MKEVFLVHIQLPDVFTFEFYELIPLQRKVINKMLERRVILNYSLDMERKNVWAIFEVKNEDELIRELNSFPIIDEVTYEVHELAFHNAAPVDLPDVILN
jgi:muconolactone delta-isomerase